MSTTPSTSISATNNYNRQAEEPITYFTITCPTRMATTVVPSLAHVQVNNSELGGTLGPPATVPAPAVTTSPLAPADIRTSDHLQPTSLLTPAPELPANWWLQGMADVWMHWIAPDLSLPDLSRLRRVCRRLGMCWDQFLDRNQISVPQDVHTVRTATLLAATLSSQKQYSTAEPLVIAIAAGRYWTMETDQTDSSPRDHKLRIGFGHVVYRGSAVHGQSTHIYGTLHAAAGICGGVIVFNHLVVTGQRGQPGLLVTGGTAAEMHDTSVVDSGADGLQVFGGARVLAERCRLHGNGGHGAVINDLYSVGTFNDCDIVNNVKTGVTGLARAHVHFGRELSIRKNGSAGVSVSGGAHLFIHDPAELAQKVQENGVSAGGRSRDVVASGGGRIYTSRQIYPPRLISGP